MTADVRRNVEQALAEDIGTGDVTTLACVPEEQEASGSFVARQDLVVAGLGLLPVLYEIHGGVPSVELKAADGHRVRPGEILAVVRGRARSLLTCERVALNFLQRLCGVATLGARYVEAVRGTRCRILDTRKTTPGLRAFEKQAAAAGGVTNHRMGLWDAVLIKNNHITAAGGARAALDRVRSLGLPVEIEVRTREEMREALDWGATRLLLDNLTPSEAAEWIREINGRAKVELSGGITVDNARAYADAGADFLSAGAITHSAAAADINFRLQLS